MRTNEMTPEVIDFTNAIVIAGYCDFIDMARKVERAECVEHLNHLLLNLVGANRRFSGHDSYYEAHLAEYKKIIGLYNASTATVRAAKAKAERDLATARAILAAN